VSHERQGKLASANNPPVWSVVAHAKQLVEPEEPDGQETSAGLDVPS